MNALEKLIGIAIAETTLRFNLQSDPQCHGAMPPDPEDLIRDIETIKSLAQQCISKSELVDDELNYEHLGRRVVEFAVESLENKDTREQATERLNTTFHDLTYHLYEMALAQGDTDETENPPDTD